MYKFNAIKTFYLLPTIKITNSKWEFYIDFRFLNLILELFHYTKKLFRLSDIAHTTSKEYTGRSVKNGSYKKIKSKESSIKR